jgi:hypothetical protein
MSMAGVNDSEVAEMRERLRTFLSEDPEESLSGSLARALRDPTKPRTDKGRLRLNPLLLFLSAIALVATSAFLAFSFGHP